MSRVSIEGEHYSYSQARMFASCPQKWFLRYIEKVPTTPLYVLESGKAVHRGLEVHNLARFEGKRGLHCDEVLEVAVAELESLENPEELDVTLGKAKDQLVKDGLEPVAAYLAQTEQMLWAGAGDGEFEAEKFLEFEVAGKRVIGYVDLVLPHTFTDYKLSSRRKSEHQIMYDPQLHIYSEVIGKPGGFTELIRGRSVARLSPQPKNVAARRGAIKWLEDTVQAMEQAKKTGLFPRCQPGSWECSPKGCQMHRICFPHE
jgi:hypothetical protein